MKGIDASALGKIFLSYSHADADFAKWLDAELRRRGFLTWLDEKDLVAGDDIVRSVSEALLAARIVVIVISTTSISRPWVRYELSSATTRAIDGKCRVIPALLDGSKVPAMIEHLLFADFRRDRLSGLGKVLDALNKDAAAISRSQAPSLQSERAFERLQAVRAIIADEFGPHRYAQWEEDEFRTYDFEAFELRYDGNRHLSVVYYEFTQSYPIDEDDIERFDRFVSDDIIESYGLLVSDQPIDPQVKASLFKLPIGGAYYTNREGKPRTRSATLAILEVPVPIANAELRLRLKYLRHVFVADHRSRKAMDERD